MKVFNLQYINNGIEGVATIEACNAKSASTLLQSLGRMNSSRYKVISIKEVGENDSPIERIISEFFAEECGCIDNSNGKFDINSLSKEDINSLKLRINEYTGTLYVDRIGDAFREKAKDGHTVFYINNVWPETDIRTGALFIKHNGIYKNLGYPSKYKFIESPKKKIQVKYNFKKLEEGMSPLDKRIVVEDFYKRLGIFYKQCHRGRYRRSDKLHVGSRGYRWRFIRPFSGNTISKYDILKGYQIIDFLRTKKNKYKIAYKVKNEGNYAVYKIAVGEMKKIKGYGGLTFINLKGVPLIEFSIVDRY